jgi:hypothetical protein
MYRLPHGRNIALFSIVPPFTVGKGKAFIEMKYIIFKHGLYLGR